MKTLKKVLSLVLVVAMIASMLIVGAAAAEETQYPEAAAVISGIKVMEGDERGMRYGDTVTRAEAAAIICRILLGDTAETLAITTTTAPYADVAASHWAAGYIAYLKGQGIVSGRGNGFAPNDNVTSIEFAKMLLTAVGYGKAGEFDGAAWDINTVTFANENDIFDGTNEVILYDAATREECMLYAYNALMVPTVKYNKTFESYYTGASALNPETDEAELMKWTLAATKFGLDDVDDVDVFGRPASDFYLGTDLLADNVVNTAPVFTAENTVYGATLAAKLGTSAAKITKIDQWVDGEKTPNAFSTAILDTTSAASYTAVADNGAITEAYVSGTTLTLVTYYEYIATVTAVDAKTGVVTLTNGDATTAKGIIPGVAVNDVVIYTKDNDANDVTAYKVVSAVKATPAAGTFQSIQRVGTLDLCVIGGVSYTVSAKLDGTMPTANDFGKAYNVYTDSLGNALKAVYVPSVVTSNDYLYLVDSISTAEYQVGFNTVPASAQLKVVYANGGTEVVDYAVAQSLVDGKYYYTVPVKGTTVVEDGKVAASGKWYSYITNDAGEVTLVAEAAVATDKLVVDTGKYSVGGTAARAYSKTVLNVVNAKGEVSTYVGIANFPNDVTENYTTMIVTDYYGTTVEVINAYAGTDGVVVEVPVVGYCAQYLYRDANGYHYTFFVNGEAIELVNYAAPLTTGNAYIVTNTTYGYAVSGDYTTDNAVYDTTNLVYDDAHIISFVDDQYFVTKTGTAIYYNEYTVVYDLAAGGAPATLTAGRAITYSVVDGTAVYVWLH